MSSFLIPISLSMSFSPLEGDKFEQEYQKLSLDSDEQLLFRNLRAKRDMSSAEAIIINLLVSLHKKVDELETQRAKSSYLELEYKDEPLESIGFEHILLKQNILEPSKHYYARVKLPLYPKKLIAFYFEAIDETKAKITKISSSSEDEWNSFISIKEREIIRINKEVRE